jgi:hypothetical protein
MTPETVGPLSRLIDVMKIPPRGQEVHVEATAGNAPPWPRTSASRESRHFPVITS